jgi:heat shock protein HslJ
VTLTFEDGNVSMNAGCNTYFGPVDLGGGTLSAPQLAGTMMACDEALMSQDEWLVAFLASGPTWTYADGTLELTDGTDTLIFSDTPPDRTANLTSTGWRVTDLISNTSTASSVSAVNPDVEAWIRILPNGEVGLNTGCNGGGGSVQISPTDLSWDSIITTLIACEGPADETERVMLAVLKDTTPYEVATSPSGPVLTIMSADGSSGLMFVADPRTGADMAVEAPADSATSSADTTTG